MAARMATRVLVIDARTLTPEADSGSLRMLRLLGLLADLGCQVTFAPGDLDPGPALAARLGASGVRTLSRADAGSIADHLARHGRTYDAVVLSRIEVVACHLPAVRRHAPQAAVVFDTVDLHHLRAYREARLRGSAGLLRQALALKARELGAVAGADWTLAVTDAERALLERECPGARVRVLGNVHVPVAPLTPLAARRDVAFVGSVDHAPNRDAVAWLLGALQPRWQALRPDARLLVVGAGWGDVVSGEVPGVALAGHVPDVDALLDRCRLTVAPLRFGAGVKGKVLASLARGVPVVASSLALEGIPPEAGPGALVADEPEAFAGAVVRLHDDDALWGRLSAGGLRIVERHFSPRVARERLASLLDEIARAPRRAAGPA